MPTACSYILLRIFILSFFFIRFFLWNGPFPADIPCKIYIYIYIIIFFFLHQHYRIINVRPTRSMLHNETHGFCQPRACRDMVGSRLPHVKSLSNSSNNHAVPFDGKFASVFPYKWKEPLLLKVVYCRRNNPVLLF